jgi:hypothetical protein
MTLCGELPIRQLDEKWVMIERDREQYLCEVATGKVSETLPLGWDFVSVHGYFGDSQKMATSPDGKYIVFVGVYPLSDYLPTPATVFAYNTVSGDIYVVHHIIVQEYTRINRWVDGTDLVFLETGLNPEWSARTVFLLDVSRTDGYVDALTNVRFAPRYYADPPRLDAFHGWENFGNGVWIACMIQQIDMAALRKIIHVYPDGICVPEYGEPLGVGYYRNVGIVYTFPAPTQLIRYDTATRKQKVLFEGEIERVLWVSEDERYALLLLDDDGAIGTVAGYYGSMWSNAEPHAIYDIFIGCCVTNPPMSIVDLSTGKVFFTKAGY